MLRVQVMLGAFTNKVTFINVVKQNLFRKKVLFIKEISKLEGKIMNQICPQYISTTVHKRHYYMTACKDAYKILDEVKEQIRIKGYSLAIKEMKQK